MSGIHQGVQASSVIQSPPPFAFTISSNLTNANLRTLAVNAGWNQSVRVIATVSSGVVISGNTQGNSTAALTINGTFPNGVLLVNEGFIRGRGGNGGKGGKDTPSHDGFAGQAGGRALLVSVPVFIQNKGQIGGGGGGGGGGSGFVGDKFSSGRGGGGGGGGMSSNIDSFGGAGGAGAVNGNPGQPGTLASAGAGGSGSPRGGSGGIVGNAGEAGQNRTGTGGAGGAAGQAISGNSNITYIATGTRQGPIV